MKTEKEIIARLEKVNKLIARMEKHNNKYAELRDKSLRSLGIKDIFYQRVYHYKRKMQETYKVWLEANNYKRGLEWVIGRVVE